MRIKTFDVLLSYFTLVDWLKPVILTTWKQKPGGLWLKAIPGKKFAKLHLNQWLGIVTCACHISYMMNHKREDCSPGWLGHKERHFLTNNQCKNG
jgi:hypothetical protein